MTHRLRAPSSRARAGVASTKKNVAPPSAAYTASVVAFAPLNCRFRNSRERQHRVRAARLDDARTRRATRRRGLRRRTAPCCSMSARARDAEPRADAQERAQDVERDRDRCLGLRDVPQRDHDRGDDRERDVDEEHEAPRHRIDQPAADERTDRARHAGEPDHAPIARLRGPRANVAPMIARLPGTRKRAADALDGSRRSRALADVGAAAHATLRDRERDQPGDERLAPMP